MPTTLLGLAIFLTLLTPGLAFVIAREVTFPTGARSPFRESVELVATSFVCDVAVLIVFALDRAMFPGRTPDVGALVRSGHAYVSVQYAWVAAWSLLLLLLAC